MQIPEIEIIVSKDGAELLRKTVRPGDYVIGREPGCEVQVEVDGVSTRHAQLTVNFDHALIEDLGSDSGTLINGQPVKEPTRLWPNQKIQVGAATIELHRIRAAPLPDVSLAPSTAAVRRLLPEEFLRDKKYEIGKIVAQGGMGAILDARDATTDRRVAMKVMLDSSSPDDLTRFVAEAKVTAQLEHPSIVPVYELSVDENGQVFYTMKMVRGTTLRKVLELLAEGHAGTVKRYPLPALLTIFQKVCDALAFAHARGVIHRDLKPENIMLDDFGVVLVMDWGLAKLIGQKPTPAKEDGRRLVRTLPPEVSGATMAGTVMGTPQYMSPEQARGEVENLDVRCDIYALGTILYHILALHPPVSGNDAWDIVAKVSQGAVEPLAAPKNRTIPDSIAAVVRKAMAFKRDERYPHVADLQRDIEAYQNGRATTAENAGLGKQLVLLVKRHKALFGTAAAAWVIITALAVWFVLGIRSRERRAVRGELSARIQRDRAESTLVELRGTAPTFHSQAKALLDESKTDEALKKIGYAIQLDENNADYRLLRAHMLESSQNLSAAAEEYRRVLALRSGDPAAERNLALCERLLAENGPGDLKRESVLKLVDDLFAQKRAVEAAPMAIKFGKGTEQLETAILARLKEFTNQPKWGGSRLSRLPDGTFRLDLSGLAATEVPKLPGMPISELLFSDTAVSELTPVRDLPLTQLHFPNSKVTDITPLRGMKLKRLLANQCPATDLTPLEGMPLEFLGWIGNACRYTDLTPLHGMPLKELAISFGKVRNLSPLAGLPLERLTFDSLEVTDLSPLRGMPLRHLSMRTCPAPLDLMPLADCSQLETIALPLLPLNLSVLRKLPKLTKISFGDVKTPDYAPEQFWKEFAPGLEQKEKEFRVQTQLYGAIRAMNLPVKPESVVQVNADALATVNLKRIRDLKDLSHLQGLPIEELDITETGVSDLSPLKGMPLKRLLCGNTLVTDLSPLRGMALTVIHLEYTRITDVSLLAEIGELEEVMIPTGAKNVAALRKLPKLRYLSTMWDGNKKLPSKTAEEFWKEYDAQHPAAPK